VSIQDEASQMVARLLDVQPGETVLDVCAAPGGKAALLASAAGRQGRVVAADVHLHRLRTMRESLARVGAGNVVLVALDGARSLPFSEKFPRILVDAPCSGTGTLARNPEIRWRLAPADLDDLHRRQVALLSHALEQLAPGGRLVYSTCSLEAEENEQVVEECLRQREDVRPVRADLRLGERTNQARIAQPDAGGTERTSPIDEAGFFRTFPHQHGTDGFFAAILEKPEQTAMAIQGKLATFPLE
jgi:16S rRNA (cytosine967-C5)-methyltransferase